MPLPTLAEYFLQNKTLISELADAKLEKSFQIFAVAAAADESDDVLKTGQRKASLNEALKLPLNKEQLARALALAEELEKKNPTKKIAKEPLKENDLDEENEDDYYAAFTNGLQRDLLKNPEYEFVLSAYPWLIEDKSAPDRGNKLKTYLEETIDLNSRLKDGKEAEIREKIKNFLALKKQEEAEKEAENSKAGASAKPKTASLSLLLSEQIKEKIKEEVSPKPIKTDNYDRVNFLIRSVASTVGDIAPKPKLNFEQFIKEDFTLDSFEAEIVEKKQQLEEAKSDRRDLVPDSIIYLEKLAKALDENSSGIRRSIKNRLGWSQEKVIGEDPEYVAAKDLFGTEGGLTEENFSEFFQRGEDEKFEIVAAKAAELNPQDEEQSGIDAGKLEEELAGLNRLILAASEPASGRFSPDTKSWASFLTETKGFVSTFKTADFPNIAKAIFVDETPPTNAQGIEKKFKRFFQQEGKKTDASRVITGTAELEELLSKSSQPSLPTEKEIGEAITELNKTIVRAKKIGSGKDWIKNIFSVLPAVKFQGQYKSIAKILKFDVEAEGWESKIKKDEFEKRFNDFFEQDPNNDRAVKIKDDKKEDLITRGYVEQTESEELKKLKKFLEHLNSVEKGFYAKPNSEVITSLKTVEMPDDQIPEKYNSVLLGVEQTLSAFPGKFEEIFAVNGEKHKLKEEKRKDLVIAARNQPSPFAPLSPAVSTILATSTTPAKENAPTLVEEFSASLSKGAVAGQLLANEKFKTLNQLFPERTSDEEKAKILKSDKKLEKNLQKIWAKSLNPPAVEPVAATDDSKTAMTKFVIALQEIEVYKEKDLAAKYDLDELKKAFTSSNFVNLYKESLFYASLEGNNKLVTPPLTSDDITLYKGFNKYYESAARVLVSNNKLSEEEANTAFEPAMGFKDSFSLLKEKADSANGKKIDTAASTIIKAHKEKFFSKIKEFYPSDYDSTSAEVTALSKEINTTNEENARLEKNSEATERALSTYFGFSGRKFQDYKGQFEGFLHLQLEGDSLPKDVLAIASRCTDDGTLNQSDQELLAKIIKLEAEKKAALARLAELGQTTLHNAPSLEDSEKTALKTKFQELKEKSDLEKVAYDAQKAAFEALLNEISQLKIRATSPEILQEKDDALAMAKRDLEETTSRKEAELSELKESLLKEKQLSFRLKAELEKIGAGQEEFKEFLQSSLENSEERASILSLESQTVAMQLVNLNDDTVSRSSKELYSAVEEGLLSESAISQARCEEEKEEFKQQALDLIEAIARGKSPLELALAMDDRIKVFIRIIEESLTSGDGQLENADSQELLGKLQGFVSTLNYNEADSSGKFADYARLFEGEGEGEKNLNVVFKSIDLTHHLWEKEQKKLNDASHPDEGVGNEEDFKTASKETGNQKAVEAIQIQRVFRGHLGRKEAKEQKKLNDASHPGEGVGNEEDLKTASKETENQNKAAIKIQRVFRGNIGREEAELKEEARKKGFLDHTATKKLPKEEAVIASEVLTPPLPPLDVDKCLKNAIALMKTYAGNRIDLSRETFGKAVKRESDVASKESEVIITLGEKEIAQLAKLDPIRLNNSRFGGLTFDFAGADKEDVKKFLKNTYCADFRNCTIKNLKLDEIFSGVAPGSEALKEKEEILKSFSTVKFLNCKFEEYQPTPGFRFRVENITNSEPSKVSGLDQTTQISPPSGSPRATEIQKVTGNAKMASVELVARGGYIPSYNAGPARGA